jgi:hypothetical protein
MKQVLLSAIVSALVAGIVVQFYRAYGDGDDPPRTDTRPTSEAPVQDIGAASAAPSLSYTDALVEDVWIDAARTAGDDHRSLTDADNSICFITKIEVSGIQGPDDTSSCAMEIDEFTGYWDLVATVEEGGQSQIRCNARCLVWEERETQ